MVRYNSNCHSQEAIGSFIFGAVAVSDSDHYQSDQKKEGLLLLDSVGPLAKLESPSNILFVVYSSSFAQAES